MFSCYSGNARTGVQKRTKGGDWNGNPDKHILVAKPARGGARFGKTGEDGKEFSGFRTLLKSSLVGATIKAHGQIYKVIE